MVLHVAGRKHARHAGHGGHALQATLGNDVAVLHVQLAFENIGVGLVANGNEAALQGQVAGAVVGGAFEAHAGHTAGVAQHFVQHAVRLQHDLAAADFVHQLVDHDGLGFELVAAMHQMHLAGDVGQVQGLFHRRVAAADHTHGLFTVKEAVTGGAAGDAPAHEGLL